MAIVLVYSAEGTSYHSEVIMLITTQTNTVA